MKLLKGEDSALSKAEIKDLAKLEAQNMLNNGWDKMPDLLVYSRKLIEYLTVFCGEIESNVRDEISKNSGTLEVSNAKLSIGSTGMRLNYSDDPIYEDIYKSLKNREELLKQKFKMDEQLFDKDGIEIPKVSIKSQSKETLMVKF